MRLRRNNPLRTFAIVVCVAAASAASAGSASAATPSVSPYGEVARFGGLDTGASYSTAGSAPTTGLTGVGQPVQFVYPVAMAVDTEDPNAPDKYAIYVLENVNPQALDAVNSNAPKSLSLEYRIQKISDSGTVLASTPTFTLSSSASEPGLHAVSLAVNGPADRVYALIADVPSVSENSEHFGAADKIDAWTTGLAPAVELKSGIADNLPEDSSTGAGELAGPLHDPLQGLGGKEFVGDIDGVSLAVYGHGAGSDLALGGNQYVSASASQPTIELVKTGGTQAGQVDGSPWTNAAATETSDAKSAAQGSQYLYSLSANEGESLNVSLGGEDQAEFADFEPNMATVGGGALGSTTALFPSGIVGENFLTPEPNTNAPYNVDAAVTMGFSQDTYHNESGTFMPWGATRAAGALAPSVVQLGGGTGFPVGLYAGIVAGQPGTYVDRQNPSPSAGNPKTPPTWKEVNASQEPEGAGLRQIESPASLGVRIFDVAGESLGMIGDATPGGACNLQSSPPPAYLFGYAETRSPSFVALAPGREGVVFVLVQPDLLNLEGASAEGIAPKHALGAGEGDQIVEFAPAGGAGAGANASKYHECPQPEGGFSIANETSKEPPSTGNGEVSVRSGTTLRFDAEEVKGPKGEYLSGVNLRGGSPWAYDWNLEGGTSKGAGPIFEFPWTVRNTFTEAPEANHAYQWPLPAVEAEFKTPGIYTETLNLVNDFGTLTAQRTLRVIPAGEITGAKVSASSGPTEGQPVLLEALATLPADDKVKDYHWEFGDGQGEDTGEHAAVEHTYASAGSYTVKLTISDALGQTAEAEQTVAVAKKETTTTTTTTTATSSTSTGTSKSVTTTTTTTTKTTTTQTKSRPLTRAQKLAAAMKACKKIKAHKKRAHCEKQALKRYGTKRNAKAKRGSRK